LISVQHRSDGRSALRFADAFAEAVMSRRQPGDETRGNRLLAPRDRCKSPLASVIIMEGFSSSIALASSSERQ
jgi:hypothetical protein